MDNFKIHASEKIEQNDLIDLLESDNGSEKNSSKSNKKKSDDGISSIVLSDRERGLANKSGKDSDDKSDESTSDDKKKEESKKKKAPTQKKKINFCKATHFDLFVAEGNICDGQERFTGVKMEYNRAVAPGFTIGHCFAGGQSTGEPPSYMLVANYEDNLSNIFSRLIGDRLLLDEDKNENGQSNPMIASIKAQSVNRTTALLNKRNKKKATKIGLTGQLSSSGQYVSNLTMAFRELGVTSSILLRGLEDRKMFRTSLTYKPPSNQQNYSFSFSSMEGAELSYSCAVSPHLILGTQLNYRYEKAKSALAFGARYDDGTNVLAATISDSHSPLFAPNIKNAKGMAQFIYAQKSPFSKWCSKLMLVRDKPGKKIRLRDSYKFRPIASVGYEVIFPSVGLLKATLNSNRTAGCLLRFSLSPVMAISLACEIDYPDKEYKAGVGVSLGF